MLSIWGSTFPKPTLDLNFIGASSLDSRVTFTRGSAATMFDSTGTLVYAPMNLLTYSEQFDNAAWTQFQSSVTANATTAPNATTTADKFIPNATLNGHYLISSATSMTSGTTYVGSVYAKASEQTVLQLTFQGASHGSTYYANFNLSNGTLGNTGGAGVVATITSVSDGWYRCSIAAAATATASAGLVVLSVTSTTDGRLPTYLGDGTSGLFIWGAQLNLSPMAGGITSSLSTYYPTTTSAYYGPRFDYNPSTLAAQGLLIEEQRTNSIRNNTMVGAVAGTPGTLPTNWSWGGTATFAVVATGTESGIAYIDLRIQGASAADTWNLFYEVTSQVAAVNGQSWTGGVYFKLVAGSTTNLPLIQRLVFRNSSLANIQQLDSAVLAPTTANLSTQRNTISSTATQATTAYVTLQLNSGTPTGAFDITLRIGLPQLELGAFATSVIPTSTVAVTRSADVASMTGTNFSSWYNQTEGSFVVNASVISNSGSRVFMDVGPNSVFGTTAYVVQGATSVALAPATAPVNMTSSVNTTSLSNKAAIGIAANNAIIAVNGSLGTVDNSCAMPASATQLVLGHAIWASNGTQLDGWLQRISYYPTRLPNATLQALTA